MALRLCPGCQQFYEKNGKPRCARCMRQTDRERGSRRERGIGPNHERFAKMIKERRWPCARCGHPFGDPDNPITVGHIVSRVHCLAIGKDPDDPQNQIPECRSCNLSKGDRDNGHQAR
jgi:5-methylcytosine-specific restriction endonuclease McrA